MDEKVIFCLIPLSVLAKAFEKYGVKPYKPYNDAKKLLSEKYKLEIIDTSEGKAIKVEGDEELKRFFSYIVEELLGRGETIGQRITYEGIPFEKYENLFRELMDCEKERALANEKLNYSERLVKTLEKQIEELKKEKAKLETEVKNLEQKLEKFKKEKTKEEIISYIKTLTGMLEKLPQKEKEKVLKILEELKGKLQ
jgi:predicted  nucleic acid-binding Zn-ribbon protein